jgi:hypothetical protein
LFPCYQTELPELRLKTIWFNYIPTQTGFAEVIVLGAPGGGLDPLLARYPGGCGSFPSECLGGDLFFSSAKPLRLYFSTVAGEPVLLALAAWAGGFRDMTLHVNLLPPPCELTIPAGAIAESEERACAEPSNDGCNSSPPAFDTIAFGQSVQGTLFNTTVLRDTDWFEFTVPTRLAEVTVSFAAQYPSKVAILEPQVDPDTCVRPSLFDIGTISFGQMCETTTGSVELEAGTYRLVISNAYFDGIGCGAGYEQYWLSLSGRAVVVPCGQSDFAGPGQSLGFDGELTADDIIVYLNAFLPATSSRTLPGLGSPPASTGSSLPTTSSCS